jgi:hypothetical protein
MSLAAHGFVPPAAANPTPGCVSKVEFQRIHQGMTRVQVHRLTDAYGHQTLHYTDHGRRFEVRDYPPCARHSRESVVAIRYIFRDDGRVLVNWKDALFR